jgi:hydroxysqualene dehydroxylase
VTTTTVHVVGAGLAGLAAAAAVTADGSRVRVYEGAGHAGGRCRTYVDEHLGRHVDNGNHLLLSGNRDTYAYLQRFDATDRLSGPARAAFPFLDLSTGERWTVRPTPGRMPWWIFMPSRRVPGTRARDYLSALRLGRARADATVAHCLGDDGALYRRFWEPLAVAALNADADEGAAALLWPVLKETFARGEAACRPRMAALGLSHCFVDPALDWLRRAGQPVQFNARLKALDLQGDHVASLVFADGERVPVTSRDAVVLALPPAAVATLLPDVTVPEGSRAIVNAHFRLPAGRAPETSFLGLIGGLGQWLFVRDDVASVTVSAADQLAADPSAGDIAARLWPEVARALGFGQGLAHGPLPAFRIIKEKRATFAQTTDQVRRRSPAVTKWKNLFLAGDWTDTGLPATIEGSVRSGHTAAHEARRFRSSP